MTRLFCAFTLAQYVVAAPAHPIRRVIAGGEDGCALLNKDHLHIAEYLRCGRWRFERWRSRRYACSVMPWPILRAGLARRPRRCSWVPLRPGMMIIAKRLLSRAVWGLRRVVCRLIGSYRVC